MRVEEAPGGVMWVWVCVAVLMVDAVPGRPVEDRTLRTMEPEDSSAVISNAVLSRYNLFNLLVRQSHLNTKDLANGEKVSQRLLAF